MAKAKRKGANVAPLPDRLTRRRLLRAKINKPDLWVIAAVVDTRSLPCDRGGGVAAVALNGGSTMGVVHVVSTVIFREGAIGLVLVVHLFQQCAGRRLGARICSTGYR